MNCALYHWLLSDKVVVPFSEDGEKTLQPLTALKLTRKHEEQYVSSVLKSSQGLPHHSRMQSQ